MREICEMGIDWEDFFERESFINVLEVANVRIDPYAFRH
jgi:hypothetical protein